MSRISFVTGRDFFAALVLFLVLGFASSAMGET